MLLSMLLSCALGKRLHGKTYVLVVIINLALISFFSVGIPEYRFNEHEYVYPTGEKGIVLENPIPLSFPLHASLSLYNPHIPRGAAWLYQLYFFNSMFRETWVSTSGWGERLLNLTMFDYVLYYSFFMLVNIVGAAIGYWMSKPTSKDRLRKIRTLTRKDLAFIIFGTVLVVCSAHSLHCAYQVWSEYQSALIGLGRPIIVVTEHRIGEFPPVVLAAREYVLLFPQYFLVSLMTAVFGLILMAMLSRRRIFLVPLILMVSSAFLFFGAYKIWEIYQLATLQALTPSLPNYDWVIADAIDSYRAWFPLYIQIGLIIVTNGLFLTVLGLKRHYEEKAEISSPRMPEESDNSKGILV